MNNLESKHWSESHEIWPVDVILQKKNFYQNFLQNVWSGN